MYNHDKDFLMSLYREWKSIKGKKARGEFVRHWTDGHVKGLTRDVLYRHFRNFDKKGFLPIHSRADKGKPRVSKDEESFFNDMKVIASIRLASATNHKSQFFKKGRFLPTDLAIDIAYSQGRIKEKYAVSTVRYWLQKKGYNELALLRELAAVHVRANLSNEVWMLDFSPSESVYLHEKTRKLVYDNTIAQDKNHGAERLKRNRLQKIQICYMVDKYVSPQN